MVIIILRKIILGLPYFRYTILFKLFIYGISLACEDLGISGPMNRWSMTIASLRNTVDKYGCLQPGISLNGHWNREHHDNPLKLGYPFIQTNQTDWSSSACQWATWYIISRSAYFIDSHIYLFFRSFLKYNRNGAVQKRRIKPANLWTMRKASCDPAPRAMVLPTILADVCVYTCVCNNMYIYILIII